MTKCALLFCAGPPPTTSDMGTIGLDGVSGPHSKLSSSHPREAHMDAAPPRHDGGLKSAEDPSYYMRRSLYIFLLHEIVQKSINLAKGILSAKQIIRSRT